MDSIAFISDIHGNWPALRSVLNDIDKKRISEIVCLGDLVGYYSQVNEVIDEIRFRNIKSCMGNHDYAMVKNGGVIERSKTCTNTLTSQLKYISRKNLDYLCQLPDRIELMTGYGKILCMHGGLSNPIDEYINEIDEDYVKKIKEDYSALVTAHTHKPFIKKLGNFIYANSGSVGQPRDHVSNACYLEYKNGIFLIHRVQYDIDEVKNSMRIHGFADYISSILYKGYSIGEI